MRSFFILLVIILFIPMLVSSNGGPPITDPLNQSIIFDESSGVSLMEEWVTIAFEDGSSNAFSQPNLGTGHVSVKYMLKNLDIKEKELDILFLSPEVDSSSISIHKDGKQIEGVDISTMSKLPENWIYKSRKEIIEPISKKELYKTPNDFYSPQHSISGISFKINLNPNETVSLNINYKSPSGTYNLADVANQVYSQIYYLTPASFWEGDSKVNLRVEFPENSKVKLYSSIPLDKMASHLYEGKLSKIPDEEWVLTFVDSSRLIFGTNSRTIHNFIVIFIVLAGITTGVILRRKGYKLYRAIIWLLSVAFLLYFIMPTYGFMFLAYMFGPWILLSVLIIVIAVKSLNKIQKM